MAQPAPAPDKYQDRPLTGRLEVTNQGAKAWCLMQGCEYYGSWQNGYPRFDMDDARRALQAHMYTDHRLKVHEYYFSLVVNG